MIINPESVWGLTAAEITDLGCSKGAAMLSRGGSLFN
jgi:hypothetical protein